jgi:ribosomal-protein-alanine N-acetyltransferase
MEKPIVLTTDRLLLRTLDQAQAQQALDYFAGNEEFRRPWSPATAPDFLTLGCQEQRLADGHALARDGQAFRLWIFPREDFDRVIGFVALSNIVRGAFQSCHFGYEIDGRFGGQGLMTEAAGAVVEWAFEGLDLHRIEANIMPRNARSIRVVQKLGFVWEGRSPRYLRIGGVWETHDHYVRLHPTG